MSKSWEVFEKFSDVADVDSEHIFEDFLKFLDDNYVIVERGGRNGHRQSTRVIRDTLPK